MAWTYGIVNNIPHKLAYIGQTKGTLASRSASHRNRKIPMDIHMREVGVKNFTVVKLKECYEHELNALEKTYIQTIQPKYNVMYKL
jgi:excinuclease UvrABC nuclease subunit